MFYLPSHELGLHGMHLDPSVVLRDVPIMPRARDASGAYGPRLLGAAGTLASSLQIWASGEGEGGGRPPETRREPTVLAFLGSFVPREP